MIFVRQSGVLSLRAAAKVCNDEKIESQGGKRIRSFMQTREQWEVANGRYDTSRPNDPGSSRAKQ